MKNIMIGMIIGLLLGGGVTYAATHNIKLQSSDGNAITTSNPLYVHIY